MFITNTPIHGPLIEHFADLYGCDVDAATKKLLTSPMELRNEVPDEAGRKSYKLIPGHTRMGEYGPTKADVMVIGKAPNYEEYDKRRNFSGLAGDQLWNVTDSLGVDTSDWFLTNAIWYHTDDVKSRDFTNCQRLLAETINQVQPKYVLLLGAQALKGFKMLKSKAEASKSNLKNMRGAPFEWNSMIVMAAMHNSICLVDPGKTDDFKAEIGRFVDIVKTGGIAVWPEVSISTITNADELNELVDALIAAGHTKFAIDCEWGGGDWLHGKLLTIQIAWARNESAVIVLRRRGLVDSFTPSQTAVVDPLKRLFKRPGVGIIGHNVRGDLKWLTSIGIDLADEFVDNGFDTMLGYHLLKEESDLQLEIAASSILKAPRYDNKLRVWLETNRISKDRIKAEGYSMIPDEVLHPYAAWDAMVTYGLYEVIPGMLRQWPGCWEHYEDTVQPVHHALDEMEATGVAVDEQRLLEQTDLFKEKQDELLQTIRDTFNWKSFNPRSTNQVRELLFGIKPKPKSKGVSKTQAPEGAITLNLTPIKTSDDEDWARIVHHGLAGVANPSTDSESLGILAAEDPRVKSLQQFRFVDQIAKNFMRVQEENDDGELEWTGGIGANIGPDGRMHTIYRQTLKTGRYATSPNLQNMPKKQEKAIQAIFTKAGILDPRYETIRGVFQASPGHVFVEGDWNQAELWTLGACAHDEDFLNVLRSGTDIHTTMMQKMFGDKEYKGKLIRDYTVNELNKLRKSDKLLDSYRVMAKTVVFGIPYGRGGNAISRAVKQEGCICTPAEASGWIDVFFQTYPKIHAYLEWCKAQVLNPRYIVNPFGRYKHFSPTPDKMTIAKMQRESCNFPIQSSVGDAMSRALINFYGYKKFIDPNVVYRIMLSIHDAVILEVPIAHVEDVVENVMPYCMEKNVVLPGLGLQYTLGDIEISLRWGEHADPAELLSMGIPRHLCGFEDK